MGGKAVYYLKSKEENWARGLETRGNIQISPGCKTKKKDDKEQWDILREGTLEGE